MLFADFSENNANISIKHLKKKSTKNKQLIALLLNPADVPMIMVKLSELALLGETFAVLQATFCSMLVAGVE